MITIDILDIEQKDTVKFGERERSFSGSDKGKALDDGEGEKN